MKVTIPPNHNQPKKLNHVKFHQEQTDWIISIVSFVGDLITGGGMGGKYKNKSNLQLRVDNKTFKIYLRDADLARRKR